MELRDVIICELQGGEPGWKMPRHGLQGPDLVSAEIQDLLYSRNVTICLLIVHLNKYESISDATALKQRHLLERISWLALTLDNFLKQY